jgi:hypothetical protein
MTTSLIWIHTTLFDLAEIPITRARATQLNLEMNLFVSIL